MAVNRQGRAAVAVLAAAALFGTSASSWALLVPEAPAPSVAAVRVLIGAIGLIAVAWWRCGRATVLALWRRPLVWATGAAIAGYQALFFVGADRTGVAVGTLASLALAPFLAGVLGWLLREGAPGWPWAIATVIAVIGLAFLTLGDAATADRSGIAAAAGAGACYAIYTVLGGRLAKDGHDATAVLATSFVIGAIALLPFLVTAPAWWASGPGIVLALWLGLFAATLGYVLFGVGLASLQPGHVATLNLAEPVVATVLGVLVLHEALGGTGWLGCALIMGALGLLGFLELRRDAGRENGVDQMEGAIVRNQQ